MPWISNLLPFAKLKTARNVRLGEPAEKKDRRERELSRRLRFTNKDLTNLFTNYVLLWFWWWCTKLLEAKKKDEKFPFIKILCALFAPRDTLIFIDQKL